MPGSAPNLVGEKTGKRFLQLTGESANSVIADPA